jgi:type IV pilus assembly protein PilM
MFGFVQSWFAQSGSPIGVDFGSDSLRLAQVEPIGVTAGATDFKLVAAARLDVPAHLRHDLPNRMAFFAESLRDLWAKGGFRGRKAVLALPAATMAIQHLRIARMEEEALKQALPWEARGKLPYDPSHATLRHMVAGEIHQDGEQKYEVILMAAHRELVNQLLSAADRAKIEVVGMNVEPRAIVDCFGHVYRRKSDTGATTLYIDMGCAATRAYIARGQQILFARVVPIGSEQFTRAVSQALKINVDEARLLRNKLSQWPSGQASSPDPERAPGIGEPGPAGDAAAVEDAAAVSGQIDRRDPLAPVRVPPAATHPDAEAVAESYREPIGRLVEELSLCRRYHEATFPSLHVTRAIFIGGEARHRGLCQEIARGLQLPAQVGDPMVRLGRNSEIDPDCGIDVKAQNPDWSVAIGLSMGPVAAGADAPAGVASGAAAKS